MTVTKFTLSFSLLFLSTVSGQPSIPGQPSTTVPGSVSQPPPPLPPTPGTVAQQQTPIPIGSVSQPPAVTHHGVYIPIGVGEPQAQDVFTKPFGDFHTDFIHCGKRTVNYLNEGFQRADKQTNMEIKVYCEPTPTRIIMAAKAVNFGKFERNMSRECELFTCSNDDYEVKGTDLGAIKNSKGGSLHATAPEKPKNTICEAKKLEYPNNAASSPILFANEGNCEEMYKKLDGMTQGNDAEKLVQVPRWMKSNETRVNLRSFYFSDEKSENIDRVPYIFTHAPPTTGANYKPCGSTCDRGTVVKVKMVTGSYSSMIYINPAKCSSFRICFDSEDFNIDSKVPTCKEDFTIDVLVKNGVVIWGKKGRASVIELMNQHHDKGIVVPIEFGYGVHRSDKKNHGEFYIGNDHREIVTSDSDGYEDKKADKLVFMFPVEDCLKESAGIFSKNIENAKTNTRSSHVTNEPPLKEQGGEITGSVGEIATTTTQEPVFDFLRTTTPAAQRVIAEAGALSMIEEDVARSEAVYMTGKWWTWGVYFGFVVGTLVTLGIGGGTFYLMRRTVFGVWYRGMYKRYGCDASGTTGGITGIGFGNTTAAVETIVGSTTGGTTVGGTTGDSTMGGTTGGLSSSTSGTSTLAM